MERKPLFLYQAAEKRPSTALSSFLGILDALHLGILQQPVQHVFFSNLLVSGYREISLFPFGGVISELAKAGRLSITPGSALPRRYGYLKVLIS